MSVKFNRSEFDRFRAVVESFGKDATAATVEAIVEVTEDAAEDIRHVIRDSVTPTGERRAAAGRGEPGRIESKAMIDAVETDLHVEGDSLVVGSVGWLNDTTKGYEHAKFQDPGTARIEGMNSLFFAYVRAISNLRDKLVEKGFKLQ